MSSPMTSRLMRDLQAPTPSGRCEAHAYPGTDRLAQCRRSATVRVVVEGMGGSLGRFCRQHARKVEDRAVAYWMTSRRVTVEDLRGEK